MENELIIKYNGNINKIKDELGLDIEVIDCNYAIVLYSDNYTSQQLLDHPQIEQVEKSYKLEPQSKNTKLDFKPSVDLEMFGLTGKGTIIGIIDSGIDYDLDIFKDINNITKILYYWDQGKKHDLNDKLHYGKVYSSTDINQSIKKQISMDIDKGTNHGTQIAIICSSIAREANLAIVKVKKYGRCSRSTDFMRGIKFLLDKAKDLNMPISINIGYGSNENLTREPTLFEQYINDISLYWKNCISIAAGDNADKLRHKRVNLKRNDNAEIEFRIGKNEKMVELSIEANFSDTYSVYLLTPLNKKTKTITFDSKPIVDNLDQVKLIGYAYPIAPYSLTRRVVIQIISSIEIPIGIWKIVFSSSDILVGDTDIYINTNRNNLKETCFLSPSKEMTLTIPARANRAITVGSYNYNSNIKSSFSGEGDFNNSINKPDILGPGENTYIESVDYSEIITGTSTATAYVSAVCSLIMQWGIVDGNDPLLYSQKLKGLLLENALRNSDISYPNSSYGYGLLNIEDICLESLLKNNKTLCLPMKKRYSRVRKTQSEILETGNILSSVVLYTTPLTDEELTILNEKGDYLRLSDTLGVLFFNNLSSVTIEDILILPFIKTSETHLKMVLLGDVSLGTSGGTSSNEELGINFLKYSDNLSLTGKDILICVSDTGIDYLHPDFIYPDGTSKIVYLWDQTKEGNPPKGFYIGSEYTREDINKAISENDSSLSKDDVGHGTGICGVCAGLGNVNPLYEGVATDAELIVVKLAKIGGNYANSLNIAASNYAFTKSRELNKPLVINTSLGSNRMVGYTTRQGYETLYFTRGTIVVAGCGNEGNTQTHISGNLSNRELIKFIEVEVAELEKEIHIGIWVEKPDEIDISVVSPTGEESKISVISNFSTVSGRFNFENTSYTIVGSYPTSYSGQQLTSIIMNNVSKGVWKIKLSGNYITNGRYNCYLPNRKLLNIGTKFKEPNSEFTTTFPAVQSDLISVGAYNMNTESIWPSSSRGPSLVGVLNPDIVAPGVNVICSYPNSKYAKITGTSVAASCVSGISALYLQYTYADEKYRNLAFMQMLRTYLHGGATRKDNISYPNTVYGYGLVNATGMMEQFR